MPSHWQLAHAGWACVQLYTDGTMRKALRGCVPATHQQSAVTAEHCAILWAAANTWEDAVQVYSDCSAVVTNHRQGYRVAGRASKQQAGFWREIKHSGKWDQISSILKVKAHREAQEAVDAHDLLLIKGNGFADEHAKSGAMLHSNSWPATAIRDRLREEGLQVRLIGAMGQMLASCGPAGKLWAKDASVHNIECEHVPEQASLEHTQAHAEAEEAGRDILGDDYWFE